MSASPQRSAAAGELQLRRFAFGAAQKLVLRVLCRHGPEGKEILSLTLQEGLGHQNEPEVVGEACRADDIGYDIWPASLLLAKHLATHPSTVAGCSVLELGSGAGLCGLAAAALGAQRTALTDYSSAVLAVLRLNAAANGLTAATAVEHLDWEQPGRCALAELVFERVLASDVLYASVLAPRLLAAVAHFLAPTGVFLLAHQTRHAILLDPVTRRPRLEDADVPFAAFCGLAEQAGLHARQLVPQQCSSSAKSSGLAEPGALLLLAFSQSSAALEQL